MIVPSRLDWYWLITVHHPYICSTFSVPLPFFHVLVVATGFGCCADCDYDHGGSDHDYWDGGSDFLCTLVCQKVTNPFSNSIGRVPHWPWKHGSVWACLGKILRNFQTTVISCGISVSWGTDRCVGSKWTIPRIVDVDTNPKLCSHGVWQEQGWISCPTRNFETRVRGPVFKGMPRFHLISPGLKETL